MVIDSKIMLNGEELILGGVDGSSKDVQKAGVKNKVSPHWTYIGHRYDRSWVRTFSVSEPVIITFTLVEKPSEKVVTSNKRPVISGKQLTWSLSKDEILTFKDGKADFLWRDLKSYIEVDQIKISPLGSEPL